jgi:F0F1-type ATP synthase gamma subunit
MSRWLIKKLLSKIGNYKNLKKIIISMKTNSIIKITFLKKQSRLDNNTFFNLLLDNLYNLNCYISDYLLYYNIGIFFITSEKGFCGNFNSLIFQSVFFFLESSFFFVYDSFKLFCFGKKGCIASSKYFEFSNLYRKFFIKSLKIENNNSYDFFSFFLKAIMFNCLNLDLISIVYYSGWFLPNQLISNISFLIKNHFNMYIFDYASYLFILFSFFIKLFSILLNNSMFIEELVRNSVMHEIISNIDKLIDEVSLLYNFARQAEITNSLLECSACIV